jgi:hypothetical protein
MATTDQKKKLLKAKIAVALHDELGRVPKSEEIDQVFLLARGAWPSLSKAGTKEKWPARDLLTPGKFTPYFTDHLPPSA